MREGRVPSSGGGPDPYFSTPSGAELLHQRTSIRRTSTTPHNTRPHPTAPENTSPRPTSAHFDPLLTGPPCAHHTHSHSPLFLLSLPLPHSLPIHLPHLLFLLLPPLLPPLNFFSLHHLNSFLTTDMTQDVCGQEGGEEGARGSSRTRSSVRGGGEGGGVTTASQGPGAGATQEWRVSPKLTAQTGQPFSRAVRGAEAHRGGVAATGERAAGRGRVGSRQRYFGSTGAYPTSHSTRHVMEGSSP